MDLTVQENLPDIPQDDFLELYSVVFPWVLQVSG